MRPSSALSPQNRHRRGGGRGGGRVRVRWKGAHGHCSDGRALMGIAPTPQHRDEGSRVGAHCMSSAPHGPSLRGGERCVQGNLCGGHDGQVLLKEELLANLECLHFVGMQDDEKTVVRSGRWLVCNVYLGRCSDTPSHFIEVVGCTSPRTWITRGCSASATAITFVSSCNNTTILTEKI